MTSRGAPLKAEGQCPHPEKLRFPSKWRAKKHLAKSHGKSILKPYRCECGQYHLTTKKRRTDL